MWTYDNFHSLDVWWKFGNNYGIIYDNIYECIRQSRCSNSLWILSLLSFTYIVLIYRCSDSPENGSIKIDGINESDKSYLKQKMFMIGTEEADN